MTQTAGSPERLNIKIWDRFKRLPLFLIFNPLAHLLKIKNRKKRKENPNSPFVRVANLDSINVVKGRRKKLLDGKNLSFIRLVKETHFLVRSVIYHYMKTVELTDFYIRIFFNPNISWNNLKK